MNTYLDTDSIVIIIMWVSLVIEVVVTLILCGYVL